MRRSQARRLRGDGKKNKSVRKVGLGLDVPVRARRRLGDISRSSDGTFLGVVVRAGQGPRAHF